MRHIICYEGQQKVPGQFILEGALNWGEEEIPISWNFNHRDLIGWGSDIRREDDGSLTAEIKLMGGRLVPSDMTVSIYMTQAESHSWQEHIWVSKATIRSMALVPDMYWPHSSTEGNKE